MNFALRLGILAALAFATPALAENTPTLKAEVLVAGDLVRVNDLIENAGKIGNIPVFRSPDLGHTGTVQVKRILDAVRPLGMENLDTQGRIEVSVTRDARIVPLAEMQEIIAQRATDKIGVQNSQQVQVTLDAGSQPIRMDATRTGDLVLKIFNFDTQSNRFEAVFDVTGSVRPLSHKLYGSAVETTAVLVPTRTIARGEVLKAADLTVESMPRNAFGGVPRDAITTLANGVGLAARRPLVMGRPMRAADLMKPEIVEKNATVIITYQVPGITLTMRGKALENGAEGDVVQILNLQTNKPLQGIVIGPNRVTLMTFARAKDGVVASPATTQNQ